MPEQYTEQQPHTEYESYDCSTGFGTTRNYRTCTRPVTRYRTEHKTRYVQKMVEVVDGECGQVAHQALVGGVPIDDEFRLLAESASDLRDGYESGRITVFRLATCCGLAHP